MHSHAPADGLRALIREKLNPLSPIPTREPVRNNPVPGIRAVLFDVYGTLLISGSGDIGTAQPPDEAALVEAVFRESGFSLKTDRPADRVNQSLETWIKKRHDRLRARGTDHPEVDIRDIWANVLDELRSEGVLESEKKSGEAPRKEAVEELALRFELAVNPVWPMPGFPEIISELSLSGCRTGIVSNAQFYTPALIEVLGECTLENLGFPPELCAFSYRLERAKPSPLIFQGPLDTLASSGIEPGEVLMVGNDMLNDMAAARSAGCRTCLFAGDKRSLRKRGGDERTDFEPDMVITELTALRCFASSGKES